MISWKKAISEATKAGIAARRSRGLPIGRPVAFTRRKQLRALRMVEKGHSSSKIAKALDLSYQTIHNWRKTGMILRDE